MKYTKKEILAIANDRSISINERAAKLIEIGTQELELDLGIISSIKDKNYKIIYTNNPELLNQEFALGLTYCAITLTQVSTGILAVQKFSTSDYRKHPAFEAFKLETYIGSPIIINGRQFGTLNFTMSEPRAMNFSKEEKDLVKWLSEGVSRVLKEQFKLIA